MIKIHIKLILRNIFRNSLFALINVTGLALGLAISLLIGLYIHDELKYDRYHTKAERIYRVTSFSDFGGVVEKSSSCPAPLAPALQAEFPQSVLNYVRIFNDWGTEYRIEAVKPGGDTLHTAFRERNFYFVDSTYFEVFDHVFLYGNPAEALNKPGSVVVTGSVALKLFGRQDILGKSIRADGLFPLTVTGVVEDPPLQSHFRFGYLASMRTLAMRFRGQLPATWVWNPFWTYILLNDNVRPESIESQFPGFVQKYFYDAEKNHITLGLQPLTSIHLHSALDYEIEPNGNASYIRILGFIAVFLLVIAIINFMNLSTASSAGRAKEVGVKKVFGAIRSQLIGQFMLESLLMAFLAMIAALVLINLSLPAFNQFTQKMIPAATLFTWPGIAVLTILWLITGILAGTYPAFFLSSFKPVTVLKGKLTLGARSIRARKILVTFQLAVSMILIIGTFSAFRQLNYLRNTGSGFDRENILMLPVQKLPVVRTYDSFKGRLLNINGIERVTAVDYIPGKDHNSHEFKIEGFPPDKWQFFPALVVKHDFVKTFGIQIVAGRDYNQENKTDPTDGILINEAMVKHLGWKSNEDAIGRKFSSIRGQERVIGVFADIHARSLHHPRGPLVLNIKEVEWEVNYFTMFIAVRLAKGVNIQESLRQVNQAWEEFNPGIPFDYFFLDETLSRLYVHEEKGGQISALLTLLVIFVASLGLLGLVSYMAVQRTREIGIRRVLGGSVFSVVWLMSKEFLLLVGFAILISFPAGYFLINYWLSQFAFQSPPPAWLFALSGLVSAVVALGITSWQAIRAAHIAPADALRYE